MRMHPPGFFQYTFPPGDAYSRNSSRRGDELTEQIGGVLPFDEHGVHEPVAEAYFGIIRNGAAVIDAAHPWEA